MDSFLFCLVFHFKQLFCVAKINHIKFLPPPALLLPFFVLVSWCEGVLKDFSDPELKGPSY